MDTAPPSVSRGRRPPDPRTQRSAGEGLSDECFDALADVVAEGADRCHAPSGGVGEFLAVVELREGAHRGLCESGISGVRPRFGFSPSRTRVQETCSDHSGLRSW
ncbi:hypothetical protein GCM10009603_17280 [Nocardiopsis exhalans]